MKHFGVVGVLVVIVTAVVIFLLDAVGLMPIQASTQAIVIDKLFDLHVKVIAFLFALIVVFMLYSVVVFRRKPGETGDGAHFEGHHVAEISWTIAPLVIVLGFAAVGAQTLAETRQVDPQALVVKVTAMQWSWRFEYPDQQIASTKLVLPVNRQVLLQMTSQDVIHSFWVPEFRVKQDVLPGKDLVKEMRVTPNRVGDYKVRCAELCGTQHAYMESGVSVLESTDFDAWVTNEQAALAAASSPEGRGQRWAQQFGCVACHSVDGSKLVGPSWKGIYGESVDLVAGGSVKIDDAYLTQSILDPNSQVVKGYNPNIMPPTYKQQLKDDQVADLIAYIKSLK